MWTYRCCGINKIHFLGRFVANIKPVTETSVPDDYISITRLSCYFLLSELSINNRFSQCCWDENKLRKDLKSSWLFLVLPQLQCGTHKALFRSDCAFSRSFLRESYSGWMTRQTCSFSLFWGHWDLWACKLDRKDHRPTSESFPLSCQSTSPTLKSGLTLL